MKLRRTKKWCHFWGHSVDDMTGLYVYIRASDSCVKLYKLTVTRRQIRCEKRQATRGSNSLGYGSNSITSILSPQQICNKLYNKTTTNCTIDPKQIELEMWANAQRDGRPAEHRWRPLFNAAKFG